MVTFMYHISEDLDYKVERLSQGDPCSVRIVEAVDSGEFDEGERVHDVRETDDGLKKFS